MLRAIDDKFRSATRKMTNLLSKGMILFFFCIVVSTTAKYFARNAFQLIQEKTRKINILYKLEEINFDAKAFKKANNIEWAKFIKLKDNSQFNFDIMISDSITEIENFSKLNNFQVLDTEFLNKILQENSSKVEISELRDFIIFTTQNEKKIYIGINKISRFTNLSYEVISVLIRYLQLNV